MNRPKRVELHRGVSKPRYQMLMRERIPESANNLRFPCFGVLMKMADNEGASAAYLVQPIILLDCRAESLRHA